MFPNVENKQIFKWIGPESTKKFGRSSRRLYNGFTNEDLKIDVGDHVLVRNDEEYDSEAFDKCHVAKIVELYDKGNLSDDRHRAIVHWYIQINDVGRNIKKHFPETSKWELVRDDRKNLYDNDIDAETIFGKCHVNLIYSDENIPSITNFRVTQPTYYTKWIFNGKSKEAIKEKVKIQDVERQCENRVKFARRCLFDTENSDLSKSRLQIDQNGKESTRNATNSPIKSFYSPKKLRTRTQRIKYDVDFEEEEEKVEKTPKSRKRKLELTSEIKTTSGKKFRNDFNLGKNYIFDKIPKKMSNLELARHQLHVSVLPDRLPCREKEFQQIYSFVETKLCEGSSGCIYISGVPGTGKTATVFEVIRCLEKNRQNGDVPHFRFIALNGMKVTEPHQIYVQIVRELNGSKLTSNCAVDLLSKRFSKSGVKRDHVVILVDELDLLWTRRQDVLYNLFDWPTRRNAKLIVIAVANTMNLPERVMMTRVVSRVGLSRITFQPYTHQQLRQIISARISELNIFNPDAVQLVARKVGGVSGDARRALDLCRRATEIAEMDDGECVGILHVDKALNEMFASPKVQAIQNSSTYEQIVLRVLSSEVEIRGIEEMTWEKLYMDVVALCRVENIFPPNVSEVLSVCFNLSSCRLIIVEDGRKDVKLRVRLNVSPDDVYFALRPKLDTPKK